MLVAVSSAKELLFHLDFVFTFGFITQYSIFWLLHDNSSIFG